MSGRKPSEKKMKRVCLFLEEEQVEQQEEKLEEVAKKIGGGV